MDFYTEKRNLQSEENEANMKQGANVKVPRAIKRKRGCPNSATFLDAPMTFFFSFFLSFFFFFFFFFRKIGLYHIEFSVSLSISFLQVFSFLLCILFQKYNYHLTSTHLFSSAVCSGSVYFLARKKGNSKERAKRLKDTSCLKHTCNFPLTACVCQ